MTKNNLHLILELSIYSFTFEVSSQLKHFKNENLKEHQHLR